MLTSAASSQSTKGVTRWREAGGYGARWTTQSTDNALLLGTGVFSSNRCKFGGYCGLHQLVSLTNPGTHGPFSQHQIYRPDERKGK